MTVVAIIAAFSFSTSWIDTLGQRWVKCEVTSAQAVQGNNLSVTPWRVDIETSDCGSISYLKAFTKEDTQALASELTPGALYEFKLGVLSHVMLKSPIKPTTPSAKDLRSVSS